MNCHPRVTAPDMVAVSVTRPYRVHVTTSPDDPQVRAIYPFPDQRAGWVRTGPETAVPTLFEVQLHLADPELTVFMKVKVGAGGKALVREFGVSPKDLQATVTTRMLRKIPVDRLLRLSLDAVSMQVVGRPDIHPNAFQWKGDFEDRAWVSPPPAEGRGREVSPDRVARAAEIYLQALAAGSRKPAEVVAEQLQYSRATAARDIRAARDRGLLPPVGGETQGKLTPPSNPSVANDPIMPRFDDPSRWAHLTDVMEGPSGVPFYDPDADGPPPAPVPGAGPGITTPDTWLARIQEVASMPPEARDPKLSPKEIMKIMDDLAQTQGHLQERLQEAEGDSAPEEDKD